MSRFSDEDFDAMAWNAEAEARAARSDDDESLDDAIRPKGICDRCGWPKPLAELMSAERRVGRPICGDCEDEVSA